MYIRYNNSAPPRQNSSMGTKTAPLEGQGGYKPLPKPDKYKQQPPKSEGCFPPPPPKKESRGFKNPLKFLPKEVYNPDTHKFFGKLSGEDILIIGLILMVLDSGCDEDMLLVLALLYILLSDWIDFGNILF